MNKCLEELDRLQRKRQKLYESYQREEVDAQDYLLEIHHFQGEGNCSILSEQEYPAG